MAGTDASKRPRGLPADGSDGAPAVILVQPQLGENIGMVARAMLNCGLVDLRLVQPRDGWPNTHAEKAASGADVVLQGARLFDTAAEAVADLDLVYASTARGRHMTKPVVTPHRAAAEMREAAALGRRAGILLGREAKGLDNDSVALADSILMVPLNPGFSSLNLAQAALLFGYEWFQAGVEGPAREVTIPQGTRPANKAEMMGLFEHLEDELDAAGFLHVREKRPIMVRNLRNLLGRAGLTEQEVRTLRGVITALVGRRPVRKSKKDI